MILPVTVRPKSLQQGSYEEQGCCKPAAGLELKRRHISKCVDVVRLQLLFSLSELHYTLPSMLWSCDSSCMTWRELCK